MKATETRLFKFLQKSAQFIIPIYQRQYSWTQPQCDQLFEDIVNAGSTDLEAHFIGSVVYIERGLYSHSDVPQLLIIDGQQRLTSTTLLIATLMREIEHRASAEGITIIEGTNANKLKKYYLCNDAEDGDLFYKLILTRADDAAMRSIVDEKMTPDHESSQRVMQNFSFFRKKMSNASNEALNHIYHGLQKLIIVDVALDRERDNPQLIFESLNSTGLDLSQADLIRNYVLMGLEPEQQKMLYNEYWYPMESDFGHGEYSWLFNQFIRDYLTVRTGTTPRLDKVYEGFKKYVSTADGDITDVVSNVRLYSRWYISFARELEHQPILLAVFKDINAYKVDVAYPLLLELYHDHHFDILSLNEFEQCGRLIESYVFRRSICGVPPNSLSKTFANFNKSLRKDKYLESFKAEFMKLINNRRFPDDEELKRSLETKDMYNIRNRAYWLRRLENFGRKERVLVEDYTTEHVMPQNEKMPKYWQDELGKDWQRIHQACLHTIGNLTLTGYNSEYSDKSFIEKRDMEGGFAQSPLKLNQDLGRLTHFNEAAIKLRTDKISNKIATVWSYPDLDDSIVQQYKAINNLPSSYSIENHPYISTGAAKQLYQKFKAQVLALEPGIKEEFLKLYVAFKLDTNVVDVVPQASGLRLSFNAKFADIHDPKGLCKDVTNIGRWGNGDVELKITQVADLPYAMDLVQQALDLQMEG